MQRLLCPLGWLAVLSCAVVAWAQPPDATPTDVSRLRTELQGAFQNQRYADAEKIGIELVKLRPQDAGAAYNLACAQARQDKSAEALQNLAKAIELGFVDVLHLRRDPDLESLRDEPQFTKLLRQAAAAMLPPAARMEFPPPPDGLNPSEIQNGAALVTEGSTVRDGRVGLLRVYFNFPESSDEPLVKDLGEAGDLLRRWFEEGTAAGNLGDLYDNHDTDHSNMNYGKFPQLSRVEFSDELKRRRLHHGLQVSFLYSGIVLGNSSTAITSGPFWRSQPRFALTNPRHAAVLASQYYNNHLYVYPEHRDHDPGHNGLDKEGKRAGHGDVFPCNTPYLLISQGSSGSDRVFLEAIAATLAAFRPDVKRRLAETGLLMPTVQMVFRASNKLVKEPSDYLTGKAHPTVFDGGQIDLVRMVKLAHEITLETLPPLVELKVLDEDRPVLGRDYFDVAERERLFDTPSAIARVAKSTQYRRRIVVSAEASRDLSDLPLKFHWVVLRGDPARIKIERKNDAGSVAEITIGYHQRRPITPDAQLESNRVDVGVFVHNGTWFSAPAFVTYYFLDNEKRTYDERQRIQIVDYASAAKNYVDPMLDAAKNWRDEYHYDVEGQLTGWTRIRGEKGEVKESFTADGRLVIPQQEADAPRKTRAVKYVLESRPKTAPTLKQE